MNFLHYITKFGIFLGTLILSFFSGFLPFINIEAFLVWFSLTQNKNLFLVIVTLVTIGQMLAKSIMYYGGRGIIKLPLKKYEQKIEKTKEKFKEKKNHIFIFNFLSSFTGFPPFYIVSILNGTFKIDFLKFLIPGSIGRFLRFLVVILFPFLLSKKFF